MRQKDPIYESIAIMAEEDIQFENAQIKENTIIPGMNGLKVNIDKSFQKMKSFGAFNKYYLIYDQIVPEISLTNNKDKTIIKGNKKKRSIAIIAEKSGEISQYFQKNNIPLSLLVKKSTIEKETSLEQINNDTKEYDETEKILNSIKKNTHICVLNNYNEQLCKKNNQYLVQPSLELNSYNVAKVNRDLESGSIILLKSNAKLEDVKVLLKTIEYKGWQVKTLSQLIEETNEI